MSVSRTAWLRPISKILIGVAILVGLYLFALVISQMVLESAFRGVASSKSTSLSAYNLYTLILQTASWKPVERTWSGP
jgi:hypothetical protein